MGSIENDQQEKCYILIICCLSSKKVKLHKKANKKWHKYKIEIELFQFDFKLSENKLKIRQTIKNIEKKNMTLGFLLILFN